MTHPAFTTSFENREMFGWPNTATASVELTNDQWTALMCLLSVHKRQPVMSPFDTERLNAALQSITKQLKG